MADEDDAVRLWNELWDGAPLDTYILDPDQLLSAFDDAATDKIAAEIAKSAVSLMQHMHEVRKTCALCLPHRGYRFKIGEAPSGFLFARPMLGGRVGVVAPICRTCMRLTPGEQHERLTTVMTTFGVQNVKVVPVPILTPGSVTIMHVHHEDWCQHFKGGECDCRPDVEFESV